MSYGTKPPVGVRPGDIVILSNGAVANGTMSQQVRIDPNPDGHPVMVTVYNHTDAALEVFGADVDSGAANYMSVMTEKSTGGITVGTQDTFSFTTTAKYLAFKFLNTASSGVLSIGR